MPQMRTRLVDLLDAPDFTESVSDMSIQTLMIILSINYPIVDALSQYHCTVTDVAGMPVRHVACRTDQNFATWGCRMSHRSEFCDMRHVAFGVSECRIWRVFPKLLAVDIMPIYSHRARML